MLRTFWNIVSIMAVANLLALFGFFSWLVITDRITPERLGQVRALIADGEIPAAETIKTAADSDEDEEPSEPALAVSSADRLVLRLEQSEIDRQRRERLRRETNDLQRAHQAERRILDEEWAKVRRDREEFEAEMARVRSIDGSAQFRKAVKTLEGLPPRQARDALMAMIAGQDLPGTPAADDGLAGAFDATDPARDGMARAVSYLNAMGERQRIGVMEEIVKQDPALAAVLLESLRVRGVEARAREEAQ
ncbi:MAG: hypothetical protein EA423_03115 [Phycisphaerales bacterium]|nr:MAG: hypothetical protein EA423_03115 [Phycisphaerales bacterium]